MFGHDSKPSVNYVYGAKAPRFNEEEVFAQLFKSHCYGEKLTAHEIERRDRSYQALLKHFPELLEVDTKLKEIEEEVEGVREEIRAHRVKNRKQGTPARLKRKLEKLEALRGEHQKERKKIKKVAYKSPSVRPELDNISNEAYAEDKVARKESELYWGSYLKKDMDMASRRSGPPPRHRRWRGTGSLAVQLQKGMPSPEAFKPNTRFWIEQDKSSKHAIAHMRVNSDEKKKPVFAEIPFVMHRPLPDDASIMWVYLTARKVATKHVWSLCLSLARDSGWQKNDLASSGTVSVDLGWRKMPNGDVRVAYFAGDDGLSEDIRVPAKVMSRWRKADDLKSIRDKNFNETRNKFKEWIKSDKGVPDWIKNNTKYIAHWKNPIKMVKICLRWRKEGFEGDTTMYTALEAWRKQDKHLLEWQENNKRKARAWRDNYYRNAAARFSRKYRTVVFEKMDLAEMRKRHLEDDKSYGNPASQLVAPGKFRKFFEERFAKVQYVNPYDTSQICHVCGSRLRFEDARGMRVHCPRCGYRGDRDANGAYNILERGGVNIQGLFQNAQEEEADASVLVVTKTA